MIGRPAGWIGGARRTAPGVRTRRASAAEIRFVYIAVPGLEVTRMTQRDSCLRRGSDDALHLYENLEKGFRAGPPVDADGIVRDDPGRWRRLGSDGMAAQGDP